MDGRRIMAADLIIFICFFNMTNVTKLKILLFLSPYNFKL